MIDDRELGLLKDILDSAIAIDTYILGVTKVEFLANNEKQDAVLRRLEIIGEAAGKLAKETRELFPDQPWNSMRGMRNIIIHDYGAVDLDQVWYTASRELHDLRLKLSSYLSTC